MTNDDDEILYHYCSMDAFYSIIKNQSIWLSSATQSNDYMEGEMAKKQIIAKLDQALKKLSDENRNKNNAPKIHDTPNNTSIKKSIDSSIISLKKLDALIFSLSEKRDLLSQWRGYADNGSGVCIGFSKKSLSEVKSKYPTTLEIIEYNPHTQESEELENIFSEILEANGATKTNMDKRIKKLFTKTYSIKNIAFEEESEWRLIHLIKNKHHSEFDFRIANKQIIPYIEISFKKHSIKEVIIGPKNKTPKHVILTFLKHEDFTGENEKDYPRVETSSASYR